MYTTYIAWEVVIWTVFRLKSNFQEKSSPILIFELRIQRISLGKSLFEPLFVWKLIFREKFANSYLRAVCTTYIAWEVLIWTVFRLKTNVPEKSSPIRIFELCIQRISRGKSLFEPFFVWKLIFRRKVRQFVSSSCVYNVYRLGSRYLNSFSSEI